MVSMGGGGGGGGGRFLRLMVNFMVNLFYD